ncbi:N-acetylmuramoyl-L-alanine amidase [Clostridium sp. E02]|uniref:N-acetylmuramoyl-L-alanine amidase n=1 Tax=Clostridium sp. E02 TaxID=2487134 RepID=UPI000F53F0ED|nr:N-acetylmuramoyl-L-alanine amidase [Clostridium sp. E02]
MRKSFIWLVFMVLLISMTILSSCSHKTNTTVVKISSKQAAVTTTNAPVFQPAAETVYVTGSHVNVRKAPSLTGEIVTSVNQGVTMEKTGDSKAWSRVVYQDQVCYISSQFLTKDKPKSDSKPGKMIAIDPGHQAKGNSEKEPIGPGSSKRKAKVSSGTQGTATGIPEYKLNLAVSLKLKQELLDRGYQVYMIRETDDVNLSNAERAKMANQIGADSFIRIHANSLNDSSVHGALSMCQTAKNPYNGNLYNKSNALSQAVVTGICERTGFKDRGVQKTDSMSGINWCQIPVTIVEMGFMSNAEEDKKMATEEYRLKIAKGIADGIDAYYAGSN